MYSEKYEVTGREEDVAEWWRMAEKAATACNCTLSEDFGGSAVGDIVKAVHVLKRYGISTVIEKEGTLVAYVDDKRLFDSIPAKTRTLPLTKDLTEQLALVSKAYEGILFKHFRDVSVEEVQNAREAVA